MTDTFSMDIIEDFHIFKDFNNILGSETNRQTRRQVEKLKKKKKKISC